MFCHQMFILIAFDKGKKKLYTLFLNAYLFREGEADNKKKQGVIRDNGEV